MRPIKQRPIVFDNVCDCIVETNELQKAIIWYQDHPTQSKKKIYLHGYYPAVTIGRKKIHVHRLLMQYWSNRLLPSDEYVHHINHNKLDSSKSNLELMKGSEHQSLHNKGKVLSEAHKAKIASKGKLRKGMKMKKKVLIDINELTKLLKLGKSINAIAKHFKCDWTTIKSRINENPELIKETL